MKLRIGGIYRAPVDGKETAVKLCAVIQNGKGDSATVLLSNSRVLRIKADTLKTPHANDEERFNEGFRTDQARIAEKRKSK